MQTIPRKNINGALMMSILGILSDYSLFLLVSWHAPEFHGSGWIILAISWSGSIILVFAKTCGKIGYSLMIWNRNQILLDISYRLRKQLWFNVLWFVLILVLVKTIYTYFATLWLCDYVKGMKMITT